MQFCPHDLFVNTRADLGPCNRIHDDEAKRMYAEARPSARKRSFEDEFVRFCNIMLNDIDRKIQKGKQRLLLMQRDQPVMNTVSKYQDQLNNLNARIQKLVSEAEEAGIRGDVDQAKDLMVLCEQLKDERDGMVAQHESTQIKINRLATDTGVGVEGFSADSTQSTDGGGNHSPNSEQSAATTAEKKVNAGGWTQDHSVEKQMEVCEVCGAFLIVGDAQQRIEDHLMGKQHLGYARLRKAVMDIYEARRARYDDDDHQRRREERGSMDRRR